MRKPGNSLPVPRLKILIEALEERQYCSGYSFSSNSVVLQQPDVHTADLRVPGPDLPTISALDPAKGPTTGGTSVKITGTNFTSPAQVNFGTAAATSVVVNSATSITAVTPAETAATVDVQVTTAAGASATVTADQFTFTAPATLPAPVAVSPGSSTSPGPVITSLTPTFEWQAITGVTFTGYQINLHNVTANTTVSFTTGVSVTSYTVPTSAPLVAGDSYVWNVRALNGSQSGPPSVYLYFQTPAPATLPAPEALSPGSSSSPGPVITTLTPTFEWKAITGVTFTGYQINLHNVTTNTTVSFTTGISVTSYAVPASAALAAGDAYVWNVRALNGSQSGPPSVYLYFQTPAPATLPAPEAVSPGSSTSPGPVITTLTPTFEWKAITGVTFTGYQINLYNQTTSAFTTYTTGTSVTSFTVPSTAPLAAGDTYVWNVRALNGSQSGPPSVYLYFQTPAAMALPAPVAVSPGSANSPGPVLTTLTPNLEWQAITGVTFTGYQVNLYNITTSTSSTFTTGVSVTNYAITTTSPLIAGDSYVWNVRALNGTQSGPPSNYLYFQTPPAATLPAPVAISPGSSVAPGPVLTTSNPNFEWHAISGVTFTGYQISLQNLTANTTATYTTGTSVTSYTLPSGASLIAGDAYVWTVAALNGSQVGPSGVALYFQAPANTVTLPAPVALTPGAGTSPGPVLTTLTPVFTWQGITGVSFTGYQITLHDVTSNATTTYTTGTGDTTFTLPTTGTLLAGDAYVWNVRALNGSVSGPPSNYLYFQAPPTTTQLPAPVAVSPGSTESPGPVVSAAPVTFTWQAITGVTFTGYQINLHNVTTNTTATFTTGVSVTTFTLPTSQPLLAGDSYVWNVRALDGSQSGPPSDYLYFQAPPQVNLQAPVSISPGSTTSPGPLLTTTTPTFLWNAVTGVPFTGYQIYIMDLTVGGVLGYPVGASDTSFTPTTPLTPGHSYVWNVRLFNGSQSGPPSAYQYFQTPASQPIPIDSVSVAEPAPVRSTLPVSATVGEVVHSNTVVKIVNSTTAKFMGVVTTEIFASSDGTIDGDSILLGSVAKMLALKSGKSTSVSVKTKALPTDLAGTYSILARTTDPTGATSVSSYGPILQVSPPTISLSAAFAPLKSNAVKSGATIILSNFGNSSDITTLHYTAGFSTDPAGQYPVDSTETALLHRVILKPGKSIKFPLKAWKSPAESLAAGSYYLMISVTDQNGQTTTAISQSPVVIG